MTEKILFVDDELAVLEGYRRTLHKDFQPDTALGGQQALDKIAADGPYAVIVSDMRMPEMDGVQFLARVSKTSPNTVRVMLSGQADLESALKAVNEGRIFQFLTKPCEANVLKKALTTCLVQHRLITAEKDLLENTLMGSIKVLIDVLSLANPAAFSRALRLRRYVRHLVAQLGLGNQWKYEIAAMLSQLGCITLTPEIIEAAYSGKKLSQEDQTAFEMHPSVARNLLSNIPRLDGIAWIVGQQRFGAAAPEEQMPHGMKTGADLLRVACAFDDLKLQGLSDSEALTKLHYDPQFDPKILRALGTIRSDSLDMELRTVAISDLETGMIFQEEMRTNVGVLLVARGQEVSYPQIVRLKFLHQRRAIADTVLVLSPSTKE